jgi:HSP20 family molecular chaperone IbpA
MSRSTLLNSPFLLGFDQLEQVLEKVSKHAGDGYPPYNIEHRGENQIRISIAVAGFTPADLEVTVENSQLTIRGKQQTAEDANFLHRGIANRQFLRRFVLAEGMEVKGANLLDGLLDIDLVRPVPETVITKIEITEGK